MRLSVCPSVAIPYPHTSQEEIQKFIPPEQKEIEDCSWKTRIQEAEIRRMKSISLNTNQFFTKIPEKRKTKSCPSNQNGLSARKSRNAQKSQFSLSKRVRDRGGIKLKKQTQFPRIKHSARLRIMDFLVPYLNITRAPPAL